MIAVALITAPGGTVTSTADIAPVLERGVRLESEGRVGRFDYGSAR